MSAHYLEDTRQRQLEALVFLRNISLDGSYKDTVLGHFLPDVQPARPLHMPQPENAEFKNGDVFPKHSPHEKRHRVQSFVEPRLRLSSLSSGIRQKKVSARNGSCESLTTARQRHYSGSFSDCSNNSSLLELRPQRNVSREERIYVMSSRKAPVVVFSALPYSKRGQSRLESTRKNANRQLSTISDNGDSADILSLLGLRSIEGEQELSFAQLLNGRPCPLCSEDFELSLSRSVDSPELLSKDMRSSLSSVFCVCDKSYDPHLLDSPELVVGRHSTQLTLPSYIASIIYYVKPSDLKRELNDKFRQKFPKVKLTLSKLRSLKREMLKIANCECGVDLVTVAHAYVFYEKLVLKFLINKQNRKMCAGACLMLAAKLNDVKGQDLQNLIERIESGLRLNRRDLLDAEFGVLVALEFSLHVPISHVTPHYQRLIYES